MATAKQKNAMKKKAQSNTAGASMRAVDRSSKTVGTRSVQPRQKKVVAPRANRRAK